MCVSNNSKAVLIAKNCIEMYGNSMMLLLDAIMLKANTAPNSPSRHSHRTRSPLLWAVIRILYLDTARFIDLLYVRLPF